MDGWMLLMDAYQYLPFVLKKKKNGSDLFEIFKWKKKIQFNTKSQRKKKYLFQVTPTKKKYHKFFIRIFPEYGSQWKMLILVFF